MRREVKYKIKGMNRDLSNSSFSSEFSFENRNIRVTTIEGNTTLSLVNEKGLKKLTSTIENNNTIEGNVIGYSVINDILILFSTYKVENTNIDTIYKMSFTDENTLSGRILYRGNLNFSINNLIETIPLYENENVIKVYWVDGLNSPRLININSKTEDLNDKSFDFIPQFQPLSEFVEINDATAYNFSVKIDRSGKFPAGVIQYCITYFNKYGAETNIAYTSPLYYIAYSGRGGSAEEYIPQSFNIKLYKVDPNFQYVRIYSILRTSLNATPLCKVIGDYPINCRKEGDKIYTETIEAVDNGNTGYTIDPTDLLYIGGKSLIASTLEQKDNTLFLGNLKIRRQGVNEEVRKWLTNSTILDNLKFRIPKEALNSNYSYHVDKPIHKKTINTTGLYPYTNELTYTKFNPEQNSSIIKIFKYLEWYRLGLQLQYNTGEWTEPIWLKDIQNLIPPINNPQSNAAGIYSVDMFFAKPRLNLSNQKVTINGEQIPLIDALYNMGYVAIRPLVVYPKSQEKNCIMQGVINPTIFNVGDRNNGTTFAQSSWYFRPVIKTSSNCPSYCEYNNFKCIPDNRSANAEIQCIEHHPSDTYVSYGSSGINGDSSTSHMEIHKNTELPTRDVSYFNPADWEELYVVDHSIATINSPEIEFESISQDSLSDTNLVYSGIIPLTGSLVSADIEATNAVIGDNARGFMSWTGLDTSSVSKNSINRHLNTTYSWHDLSSVKLVSDSDGIKYPYGRFATYTWNRSTKLGDDADGLTSPGIKYNKRSELLFSAFTYYFADYYNGNDYDKDYQELTVENLASLSNESIKICTEDYSVFGQDNIYGKNVDSLVKIKNKEGESLNLGGTFMRKGNGYYISRITSYDNMLSEIDIKVGFNNVINFRPTDKTTYSNLFSSDPIEIKYKSTPHAIVYNDINTQKSYIPNITLNTGGIDMKIVVPNDNTNKSKKYFWSDTKEYYPRTNLIYTCDNDSKAHNFLSDHYDYLLLVDVIRDKQDTESYKTTDSNRQYYHRFKNPIINRSEDEWLDAGAPYLLKTIVNEEDENGEEVEVLKNNSTDIVWSEGDYYYSRYDCLKTYPYTTEDTNSLVEILSFMCETQINLDGRYDKNRGKSNNLYVSPENFNLINPIYNQENNFFKYRITDKQNDLDDYVNTITWSKTKTFGEDIDTWCNITLASVLDLDGDKGRVESIKKLNNELIVFQERGISQILYNDNIQISSQSGVPIEIANSGKVQGKRYLSSYIGCDNKWSICESPAGLYFIDTNTKGIYLFNGNLTNISDKLGFSSWAKYNMSGLETLTGNSYNNFISYYDPIESEVLFLNEDECLTYSERLGVFTSFYDYKNSTRPIKIGDKTILIGTLNNDANVGFYEYHAGDYNYFGGNDNEYQPSYISLIVNPEPTKDKIFNTVEFRADSFDNNGIAEDAPFTNIRVWNEYQDTGDIKFTVSNLKKKFRIWRHTIGRDFSNNRDRIRNPWTTIMLENKNSKGNKIILHDVVVSYFD